MKFLKSKKIFTLVLIFLIFSSCVSKKEVVYYQDINQSISKSTLNSFEIKIHADDLLMINVGAENPEVAAPFNLSSFQSKTSQMLSPSTDPSQLYLVDSNGIIEFPTLGKLKLGGLSRTEAINMLQEKLKSYIKNPFINLRIMNFKFSVQGEVVSPGVYNVSSERITLIEALSTAKDLTLYGRRDNILLIRENNGNKTFNRIDITKSDFINSPYYYLSQNDVIYVEPNKTKIKDRGVGANTGVVLSAVSVLLSVITFSISTFK
jgi:polysaccharide biosynthesis/export protein